MEKTLQIPGSGDIRAEVMVAEWLDGQASEWLEALTVRPMGSFRRGFSPDVLAIDRDVTEFDEPVTCVQVSRNGLYDRLPEGFFHQPGTSAEPTGEGITTGQMIRRIKKRQEEEQEARRFFRPFDQTFNRYRILLEIEERNAITGFSNSLQRELFEMIWGHYDHLLSEGQKASLLYVLPMAAEVAGEAQLMADCFSAVLQVPTEIREHYRPFVDPREERAGYARIGKAVVGIDLVLGDGPEEVDLVYEFHFGPVPKHRVAGFLPTGRSRQLIDVLCDFLVPMETEVAVRIEIAPDEFHFDLSDTAEAGRLGLTTII